MNACNCSTLAGYFVVVAVACLADEPMTTEKPPVFDAGDKLPVLVSTDDEGRPWKSADHIGDKYLVLYFYPGDFTGGCTKQAEVFREGLAKLEDQGVELVGISGDEVATHKLFKATYELKHTLLADPKGELARALGIPVSRGDKVRVRGKDGKLLLQPMPPLDGTVPPNGAQISLLQRPVTLARWTVIVAPNGKIASLRRDVNPVTDAQEVLEIVAELRK